MSKKSISNKPSNFNAKIILASGSPWRRRLLKRHGIKVAVQVSNFEEKRRHRDPKKLVLHNACGKAEAVAKHYKNAVIIGVDTIGVYRNKILLKPIDRADAKRILLFLSGKTHRVITGLCVIGLTRKPTHTSTQKKKYATTVETRVTFRKISASELERYLDSGHWKGKAGAYAIQGRAKGFVKKIEGDVTNVVGLPMKKLKNILRKL